MCYLVYLVYFLWVCGLKHDVYVFLDLIESSLTCNSTSMVKSMGSSCSNLDTSSSRNSIRSGHDLGSELLGRSYEEDDGHSAVPCWVWFRKYPFTTAVPSKVQGQYFLLTQLQEKVADGWNIAPLLRSMGSHPWSCKCVPSLPHLIYKILLG